MCTGGWDSPSRFMCRGGWEDSPSVEVRDGLAGLSLLVCVSRNLWRWVRGKTTVVWRGGWVDASIVEFGCEWNGPTSVEVQVGGPFSYRE